MTVLQMCANAAKILREQTPSEITDIWHSTLEFIESDFLPHGSGFDSGSHLDIKRSTANQLCFTTSFHAMNDAGIYCGWIYYDIIVTPSLLTQFDLQLITTANESELDEEEVNELANYIAETFDAILAEQYAPTR